MLLSLNLKLEKKIEEPCEMNEKLVNCGRPPPLVITTDFKTIPDVTRIKEIILRNLTVLSFAV